ncbi:sugar transferase [bacterium]|nr:sugar transferase [bacterium]
MHESSFIDLFGMNHLFTLFLALVLRFIYLFVFLLTLPLLAFLYFIILFIDGRPVFFKQNRVGSHGNVFTLYKFRTMSVGAHLVRDGLAVLSNDKRISPLGKILRKFSLDEIPQILNLLNGTVNIVGPRAMLPEQICYLNETQLLRFSVKPGLVGLATINGRASIPWSKRLEYDVKYIQERSLLIDMKIMFKSILMVLRGDNIYYDHNKYGPAFDLVDPSNLPQSGKSDYV